MWLQSDLQTWPSPSGSHDVLPRNRGGSQGDPTPEAVGPRGLTVPCPARSLTSSASWNLVTCVNKVERSRGQPFLRQVACTRAVR